MKRSNLLLSQLSSSVPFLVTHWADLFYLTGIRIEGYWLLTQPEDCRRCPSGCGYQSAEVKGEVQIICPELLFGQLNHFLPHLDISAGKSHINLLRKIVKKNRIKSIGIDPDRISLTLFRQLKKKLPEVKWKLCPRLISRIREIKTEEEIKLIKKSCQITKNIFSLIKKKIKPGLTERNVANMIIKGFYDNGVESAFDPIVAAGSNSAYPHHIYSDRRITRNDMVLIDMGAKYKGYCSDLTRTIFLGKIDELAVRIYQILKKTQEETIKKIRPGIKVSQLDSIARKVIAKYGYKKYFVHSTGHGLGIEIHESPRLSVKQKTVLESGMVVTVEPGIYLPDKFGVRYEDTILVTKNGHKILT